MKPRVQDIITSLNAFFVYPEISEKYIQEIEEKTEVLKDTMQYINTKNGLKKYIADYPDSLENIIMVLNVSEEYFKRIITMLRIQQGMEVTSEWSLKQTRDFFLTREWFCDKLCELFLHGIESEALSHFIPKYNLRLFKIDATTIARLSNKDVMSILLKKDYDSSFSSDCSQVNFQRVKSILDEACISNGYILEKDIAMRINGKTITVQYTIKKGQISSPIAYIMSGFYLTTGSTQTALAGKIREIKTYNKNNNPDALTIAIVDGAGWAARQGDLSTIVDYADMTYTLKTLEGIKELINTL